MSDARKLTVGSLFSGIGGLELGLERTGGFETVWQVEIDDYAARVLAKYWPEVRRWDDVRTFPPPAWVPCPECDNYLCTWHGQHAHDCEESECPDLETWDYEYGWNPYEQHHPLWHVDVICGGDPCQQNSGARAEGKCSQQSLGDDFIRIVGLLRPQYVLRENPSHIRRDAPWPWWRFRSELESLGYVVLPFRLRACCFGAIHQRERLFLLARDTNAYGERLEGWQEKTQGWITSEPAGRMDSEDWFSAHSTTGYGSRNDVPYLVDRLRCLGNAVVPAVAEFLGHMILEHYTAAREAAGGGDE